jgi:hypothetical protein
MHSKCVSKILQRQGTPLRNFLAQRCRSRVSLFVFKLVNDARETTMTFPTKSASNFERRKLQAYAAVAVAKLRDLAPYAVMELVLPGGSLMALLLWFYRRHGAALLSRRGL